MLLSEINAKLDDVTSTIMDSIDEEGLEEFFKDPDTIKKHLKLKDADIQELNNENAVYCKHKDWGNRPYYASVYDSNKKYKGGVFGKIEEIVNEEDEDYKFNGTPSEKEGLCKEIAAIKQQILTQLPGSENKSWVKKLSEQLESLKEMECTKP